MITRMLVAVAALALAACEMAPQPQPVPRPAPQASKVTIRGNESAIKAFIRVVKVVEPVAERECSARTRGVSCDFAIVVDTRPGLPANAFQTLNRAGRPIIGFTVALLADARNEDEIAFVMSHEAAHHIKGHLLRQQQSAMAGAVVSTGIAILMGADDKAIQAAQREGAFVGSRIYSKEFELEADALGTVITKKAGYDPLTGAQFFFRIPDPGNKFLGTHPPNGQRLATVRRVAAGL